MDYPPRFSASQDNHRCHAWRCPKVVPPSQLMCAYHWKMVPYRLQKDVWARYRPGQEVTKDPSESYMVAARKAIEHVKEIEIEKRREKRGTTIGD